MNNIPNELEISKLSTQKPVPHQTHVSRDISNPALEMLFLVVSNVFI